MKEITLAQFLKNPKLAIQAVDDANIDDDMQACKIAGGNYYLVSGELWGLLHQMVALAMDEENGMEATVKEEPFEEDVFKDFDVFGVNNPREILKTPLECEE